MSCVDKNPCRARFLTALPVYNEAAHVNQVLDEVLKYAGEVLVVDDGSTDGSRELLAERDDIFLSLHDQNRGYGAALRTAFEFAIVNRYDMLVTIDCDGQHEPQRICHLAAACGEADILSGSRYLDTEIDPEKAPADRREINQIITKELNELLGLDLTDAFCGFKAYRVSSLAKLSLHEDGYAMPLELWVQAAAAGLTVHEVPVPLIYLDEKRSFGGALDDAQTRLPYYRRVIQEALRRAGAIPQGVTKRKPNAMACCR